MAHNDTETNSNVLGANLGLTDLTDTVEPMSPTSPDSIVLDLTEQELDFIHGANNSNTTVENTNTLNDNAFAFLVEAGFNDPDELSMLGLNAEEIRNQQAIYDAFEQKKKSDLTTECQLRRLDIPEPSTSSSTNNNNPRVFKNEENAQFRNSIPPNQKNEETSTKIEKRKMSDEPDYNKRMKTGGDSQPIEILDLAESSCTGQQQVSQKSLGKKKMVPENNGIEPTSQVIEILDNDNDQSYAELIEILDDGNDQTNHHDFIELLDDDNSVDCIDLTLEDDIPSYSSYPSHAPIPPFVLNPNAGSEFNNYILRNYFGSINAAMNGNPSGFDARFADTNEQIPLVDSDRMHFPNSVPRDTPQHNRNIYTASNARTQATVEDAERELRSLLENIVSDDPPAPEDRAGTPDGLSIILMEHQKIGLNWMQKMENSNNKGGILADDMGLGKTIQAMSIMVQNKCTDYTPVDNSIIRSRINTLADGELRIKATLIVCPVSLIDQWRREIETKTDPKLSVLVYHGSNRTQDPYELANYDVVVSSYAVTVSNFGENNTGPFAKVTFHRVILDEAHTIKNKNTRGAVGCCKLNATYRWCMTATPIQNKIEELYSLIKFLRIRPFCDWEEFRDCIAKPMKHGDSAKAIKVAHVLMKAISLRRSKKALIDGKPILNLPARNVHMTHIDFSADERSHYDVVNQTAQARFNKYMAAGTVMKNYSSVLVLLLRLRQACLHPSLTIQEGDGTSAVNPDRQMQLAGSMSQAAVNRLLSDRAGLSEIECPICMDIAQDAQIIVGCGHIICKECFDGYWNVNDGNRKRCPQCRGELDNNKLVMVEYFVKKHAPELYQEAFAPPPVNELANLMRAQEFISSAKIDKMMEILEQTEIETNGQDKTIVFSQFTGFLDLVEKPLKEKGVAFLRYDGSMDIKHRAEVVNIFFDDPNVKVLLVSTKCGSLGLNLTVANRVILLDVWWNPALENQAIDRVHRIGQTKDVEVHRIFINDTVEDRILELQDKKQQISDGVLGEGVGHTNQRLGLQEMIYLFRGGPPPGQSAPPAGQPGPSNARR